MKIDLSRLKLHRYID